MVTRLAPTPSGYLHEGNWFSFLITLGLVHRNGGSCYWRMDDLDSPRFRQSYLDDILNTLRLLDPTPEGPSKPSMSPDRPSLPRKQIIFQSQRIDLYQDALNNLRTCGRLYPSRASRSEPQKRLQDRENLSGPAWDKAMEDPGASWWMRVEPTDQVHILQWESPWEENTYSIQNLTTPADYCIRRKANPETENPEASRPLPTYHLASLVDDRLLGTTHGVRGMDLLESTAVQAHLNQFLKGSEQNAFEQIKWVHHPLFYNNEGIKLSKSAGSRSRPLLAEKTIPQILEYLCQNASPLWLGLLEAQAHRINAIP